MDGPLAKHLVKQVIVSSGIARRSRSQIMENESVPCVDFLETEDSPKSRLDWRRGCRIGKREVTSCCRRTVLRLGDHVG